jgi:hypothetical protein
MVWKGTMCPCSTCFLLLPPNCFMLPSCCIVISQFIGLRRAIVEFIISFQRRVAKQIVFPVQGIVLGRG